MDDFGKGAVDEIRAEADGWLRLLRRFARPMKGTRKMYFWLHFVDVPVQVGALTSPQAMM